MSDDLRAEFVRLLEAYGNAAELARRGGLTPRALRYKRDGERPVSQWDVWALRQALHERDGERFVPSRVPPPGGSGE